MIKKDLINQVSELTGIEAKDVSDVLDRAMRVIINEAARGNATTLRGFGTFTPKLRKGKIGNLGKKGPTVVPPKYVPIFRPAKLFKIAVAKLGGSANG